MKMNIVQEFKEWLNAEELKAREDWLYHSAYGFRSTAKQLHERFLAFNEVNEKLSLLLNEQPEAITDDAHFCKHDVGRSAASDETSNKGVSGAASSETQAVGQNEQTKEVCRCSTDYEFTLIGGYSYCNNCGKRK